MTEKLSYGIAEAGAALGISRPTLYRLIRRGELSTFKIGARTLIRRRELEVFLERRCADGGRDQLGARF